MMIGNGENVKDLIEYSRAGIVSKELAKTDKSNITLFCMSAGTEMTEHTSTKEGAVFVLEGKGTFTLEGKKISMAPGVFIFMKKGAPHSLRAEENTSFLLSLHQ